jgi:nucleoside-diphosphate-sugar epimerase
MTTVSKTVLITGATGFIGRHVFQEFQDMGWNTIGTSRTSTSEKYLSLTLDDDEGIRRTIALVRPDVVIHLAGVAHRRAGRSEYERINNRGTEVLGQALAAICPGAILVYASSATVYGDGPFSAPITEQHPTDPSGHYAVSKLRGEEAILSQTKLIRAIALRFPALYACDWLFNVRKRAYAPPPLNHFLLHLLGSHTEYSFCAVENAMIAIRLAASGQLASGTYNVADEGPYDQATVSKVVSQLEKTEAHLHIPLPVPLIKPLYWGISALLPTKLRYRTRSAYHKLVDGMVLDCSYIQSAGYRSTVTLTGLVGRDC